jgi:hypothetical protein
MIGPDVLSSLKDIDGVYGSFVVDASGTLVLRDLPAVIDNAGLREAGPRIARLWGAFPEDDAPEHVLLEFASHQVFIKKFEAGSLCIFVPPSVNRPALKMAANFLARWLEREMVVAPAEPLPPPAPESPPSSAGASLAAERQLAERQATESQALEAGAAEKLAADPAAKLDGTRPESAPEKEAPKRKRGSFFRRST